MEKRMRKVLFVLLAFAMVLALVSCSDDVDRSLTKDRLIGKWSQDNPDYRSSYYFYEDNTCKYIETEFDDGSEIKEFTMNGTWTLEDNLAIAVFEFAYPELREGVGSGEITQYFKYADGYLFCLTKEEAEDVYDDYDSTEDKYVLMDEDD